MAQSPKQSSSSQGSSPQFIKVVQQLIQSDEEQLLAKKMAELHSTFPFLKKMNSDLSNKEKLTLFLRDANFKHRLSEILYCKGRLTAQPIIKIHLYAIRFQSPITEQLQQNDLLLVFGRFGRIAYIHVDCYSAYLMYDDHLSAYLAICSLNQFEVTVDLLRMSVTWCHGEDQTAAMNLFGSKNSQLTLCEPAPFLHIPSQKVSCKYEILLEWNNQFKLPQKIIGPNGSEMKIILEKVATKNHQSLSSIKGLVKLRLRGQGSGFRQGPNSQESEEVMHLCISAKNQELYRDVCEEIIEDYQFYFQRRHRKIMEGIAYRKKQLRKGKYIETKCCCLQELHGRWSDLKGKPIQSNRLTNFEVEALISKRNKARWQGNYKEADEVRDQLKKLGIYLIDEKKGRGRNYTTNWKYLNGI